MKFRSKPSKRTSRTPLITRRAKGIKASIAELKSASGAETAKEATAYKAEQHEIQKQAQEMEHESRDHLVRHEALAAAVTFFQIAIAITAIAVLTRKRILFLGSVGLGVAGLFWILKGLVF